MSFRRVSIGCSVSHHVQPCQLFIPTQLFLLGTLFSSLPAVLAMMAGMVEETTEVQTSTPTEEQPKNPLQTSSWDDQDSEFTRRTMIQSRTESSPTSNVVTQREILSRGCPKAPRKEEFSIQNEELRNDTHRDAIPQSIMMNFSDESSDEDEEIISLVIPPKLSLRPRLKPRRTTMQNSLARLVSKGAEADDTRKDTG